MAEKGGNKPKPKPLAGKRKKTPKRNGTLPEITDEQLRNWLKEQGGKRAK